jgi:hypothetical protein
MARGSKGRRAQRDPRRCRRAEEGKGEEGRKGKLTSGSQPSAAQKKKKRGGGRWADAGGRLGRLGQKEPGRFCFFFKLLFKPFFNSKSIQTFSNFSQEFARLFRNHTSNKKPCKPKDDAHTLVVSKFIKLSLIFLELNLNSNLISLNP